MDYIVSALSHWADSLNVILARYNIDFVMTWKSVLVLFAMAACLIILGINLTGNIKFKSIAVLIFILIGVVAATLFLLYYSASVQL